MKVEVVEDPTDTEEKKTPAKRSKNSNKKQSKVRITVVHEAFTKHLLQSPLAPVDPLSQALSLENAKIKKEVIKLKADVTELKRQSKDLSKSHKGELDELNERLAAAIQENKALLREAGAASVITAQKTKKVPAQPPTAPATQVATTQSLSPLKALVPMMMMMAQARTDTGGSRSYSKRDRRSESRSRSRSRRRSRRRDRSHSRSRSRSRSKNKKSKKDSVDADKK